MKIYDITVPMREGMHHYPGNHPFKISRDMSMEEGAPANLTSFTMSAHTGTHVDAPLHFVKDGSNIGELDLNVMIGPVKVFHLEVEEKIERFHLEALNLKGVERVLFKTANSGLWRKEGFQKKFIYISGDAAECIVESGVRLVGIDYLSVQQYGSEDSSAHRILLREGVVLLEGINLSEAPPGDYRLVALPLKVPEAEGAPARVVLIEE